MVRRALTSIGQIAADEERGRDRPGPHGDVHPFHLLPALSGTTCGDVRNARGARTSGAHLSLGGGGRLAPSRCAIRAASWRPLTSSLRRMLETWTDAVLTLMNSSSAISRLVCPAATAFSTSISRAVRPYAARAVSPLGGLARPRRRHQVDAVPRRRASSSSVRRAPMPGARRGARARSTRERCRDASREGRLGLPPAARRPCGRAARARPRPSPTRPSVAARGARGRAVPARRRPRSRRPVLGQPASAAARVDPVARTAISRAPRGPLRPGAVVTPDRGVVGERAQPERGQRRPRTSRRRSRPPGPERRRRSSYAASGRPAQSSTSAAASATARSRTPASSSDSHGQPGLFAPLPGRGQVAAHRGDARGLAQHRGRDDAARVPGQRVRDAAPAASSYRPASASTSATLASTRLPCCRPWPTRLSSTMPTRPSSTTSSRRPAMPRTWLRLM